MIFIRILSRNCKIIGNWDPIKFFYKNLNNKKIFYLHKNNN